MSLMQYRGNYTPAKPGKVEILLYLIRDVETPLHCGDCGTPVTETTVLCPGCDGFIGHVYVYPPQGEGRSWKTNWDCPEYEQCCVQGEGRRKFVLAGNRWTTEEVEKTDRGNPVLYAVWRRPAGMFGCWTLCRLNGVKRTIDFSVPTRVRELPRDAVRLTDEQMERWAKS